MQKRDEGRYRTVATSARGAMAYVVDGRDARFVTEAAYKAKKYSPAFDDLPTEDEYDA